MKLEHTILILTLIAGILAGCGGAPSASIEEDSGAAQAIEESAGSESYTSSALDASYEGALPASSQLALGIFQLEGAENAVTPEQAKALLPLWQAIQSGGLQSDAEINAVLKQIEGAMTAEQLAAIAAMQITREDLGTWMQEQGVNLGPGAGARGGQSGLGDMSEEERAAMRATRQAGGQGGFGPGGFGNMSEEEREAMRATAEASGMTFSGRPGGANRGLLAVLAEPLVELLTRLAAE
jgi:hypothetical protein